MMATREPKLFVSLPQIYGDAAQIWPYTCIHVYTTYLETVKIFPLMHSNGLFTRNTFCEISPYNSADNISKRSVLRINRFESMDIAF